MRRVEDLEELFDLVPKRTPPAGEDEDVELEARSREAILVDPEAVVGLPSMGIGKSEGLDLREAEEGSEARGVVGWVAKSRDDGGRCLFVVESEVAGLSDDFRWRARTKAGITYSSTKE